MKWLARVLDGLLNRVSPLPDFSGADWLTEAEASQEVWEPKTPTGSAAAPSPRLGGGAGGSTQEKERPRSAATAGATQERRNLVQQTITGPPLSGTGYVAFDCTKLASVQAIPAAYMGRVDCTLGGVRVSLTESDWFNVFDAVNRATNNRLHGRIIAAANARTFK